MRCGDRYVTRGRIARKTYWLFSFLPIRTLVVLATLVPSISSTVTELHDRGHSAW
jgi:uncharacterized membrane protein YhaH (DUF805 family)